MVLSKRKQKQKHHARTHQWQPKQSRHAVPCDATHMALAWQMKTLAPSSPQTIEEAEILAVDVALRSGPKSCAQVRCPRLHHVGIREVGIL